ncbi:MAG: diguanylate cyclase [Campylobacterales bacterium]|nr:diguanylate cyclase [Campylobacterales bacterium]
MKKLKVLVVDDDKITTNILFKMLENDQREVMLASSGEEGVDKFKSFGPDILLSDINMPGMNGLEMIKIIRDLDSQVKIAIFTNFDNKSYLLDAIHLGVNQFFFKPFDKEHFLQVIERLSSEIFKIKFIQRSLTRHQNILEAVNKMSQRFLQHNDWDETLYEEMHSLKDAAEASALFLFKNEESEDPKLARRFLFINENSDAQPASILPYNSLKLNALKEQLQRAESYNSLKQDVVESGQALFYEYRVNSLLIIPVFSNGTWWGFLGIGNNENRVFDATDANTLKTVAQLIGSAIDNQYNLKMLNIRSAIFKHTVDGVLIANAENEIMHINDAFTDITGYTLDEVHKENPKFFASGQHDKNFYRDLWHKIETQGYWQGEIKNRKKNGEMFIAWQSINAIKNRRGEVENYISIFSDVTAQRSDDKKYAHLATHDALTGLSNRLILNDRIEHAIFHAERTQKRVAVLFCDLDNFKPINDTYGHDVGDKVLQHCADYFRSTLRSEDTICRYGGDEFVIILEEVDSFTTMKALAEKIMQITYSPALINGHVIPVEMSMGVSVYPTDAAGEDLIKKADEAMYKAKRAGKNKMVCYQSEECFSGKENAEKDIFNFAI